MGHLVFRYWPEYTHALFGTTHPNSYGCGRAGAKPATEPIGYSEDRWNHYNVQGGLDLSLFILDHFSYTQDHKTLDGFLPIIASVLEFYANRFKANGLDEDGHMIIFPTQALETWQCPGYPPKKESCVTNDTPTVAGLHSVLEKLLALPATSSVTPAMVAEWTALLDLVPPVPMSKDKTTVVAGTTLPAAESNVENPELYTLHPYRVYSAGKGGDLRPALSAFAKKKHGSDQGWCQVGPDAALLGLGDLDDPGHAPTLIGARAKLVRHFPAQFPPF